jgi:hypothetical protein
MPKKIALLIGVSQYGEGIPPLLSALNDVEAMQRVLQNPSLGSFDQVEPLLNPTDSEMRRAIQKLFKQAAKDDLILKPKRKTFGITDQKAEQIENEVLEPLRRRFANLESYKQAFVEVIEQKYPVDEHTRKILKDYQQDILGLRDEDVAPIELEITSAKKAEYQKQAELQKHNKLTKPQSYKNKKHTGSDKNNNLSIQTNTTKPTQENDDLSSKLDFIHFSEIQNLRLKPLYSSSFSFWTLWIICDVEKVFPKKPGFLPYQENQILNFG